jgi:myo-inositol-1(or 4)-monophosphatase
VLCPLTFGGPGAFGAPDSNPALEWRHSGPMGTASERTSNSAPETADDPATLRRIAEGIVVEAAEHLRGLPRPWDETAAGSADVARDGVMTKSTRTDVVTASDHALESLIRARLAALRPADAVVGEEQGGARAATDTVWVIDPIDGTVNFLYGLPWYAISLAAVQDGSTVAGAVLEPESRRLWSAARDGGATCDGRRLRVSGTTELELTMLATGFSYSAQRRTRQINMISGMLPHVRDVRRAGSAALDLCAVAAGWVDGYIEHGSNWWDWAAAALIATEAGAVVRVPGPTGSVPPVDGLGPDAVLAATPGIADELAELARRHGAAQV